MARVLPSSNTGANSAWPKSHQNVMPIEKAQHAHLHSHITHYFLIYYHAALTRLILFKISNPNPLHRIFRCLPMMRYPRARNPSHRHHLNPDRATKTRLCFRRRSHTISYDLSRIGVDVLWRGGRGPDTSSPAGAVAPSRAFEQTPPHYSPPVVSNWIPCLYFTYALAWVVRKDATRNRK